MYRDLEKKRVYFEEYYKKNKEIYKELNQRWQENNREKRKISSKKYYMIHKEKLLNDRKEYWINNPKKRKANNEANKKLVIPKNQFCEICNKNKATNKHHSDYNFPLKVNFVCVPCHTKVHNGFR